MRDWGKFPRILKPNPSIVVCTVSLEFTPVLTLLVLVGISKSRYITITVPRCVPWYHVETINQKQCALCSLVSTKSQWHQVWEGSRLWWYKSGAACQGESRICCILVSGLHCNDDGIDGNGRVGEAFAGFVPLFLDCHRVSGQSLDQRRSLWKKIGMGQLCHCGRATDAGLL